MQPLSPRKRRVYLFALIVLFFLVLPIAIFYAQGYRFREDAGFLKTGGIFLAVPYPDASVSLNGKEVGTSGILRRSFYIGDLDPGVYSVDVRREGYTPWHRTLSVERELVTDADVFLAPTTVDIAELSSSVNAPTTTVRISPATFSEYRAEFRLPSATSTMSRVGALIIENGNVYLRWSKTGAIKPGVYCGAPSRCVSEIAIERGKQEAIHAAFFAGAVVYTVRESGVYLAEADVRPTPLTVPLYSKPGADFRVIDDRLVIKDGERLYEILGL